MQCPTYFKTSDGGKTIIGYLTGCNEVKDGWGDAKKIASGAFRNCVDLISFVVPSVTEIGGSAFYGCTSLASIEIPNSVTEIGWSAFKGCSNLTSIEIPNSVTEIGDDTFKECTSLVELHLRHKKQADFSNAFKGLDLSKITLFVPIGTGYDYRDHPFYSKFKQVVTEK